MNMTAEHLHNSKNTKEHNVCGDKMLVLLADSDLTEIISQIAKFIKQLKSWNKNY